MKIGEYQFRNLLKTPVNFVLLDFRGNLSEVDEKFVRSIFVTAENFEVVTQQSVKGDLSLPIISICRNGKISEQAAQRLDSKGYINCYYLEGGIDSLNR